MSVASHHRQPQSHPASSSLTTCQLRLHFVVLMNHLFYANGFRCVRLGLGQHRQQENSAQSQTGLPWWCTARLFPPVSPGGGRGGWGGGSPDGSAHSSEESRLLGSFSSTRCAAAASSQEAAGASQTGE